MDNAQLALGVAERAIQDLQTLVDVCRARSLDVPKAMLEGAQQALDEWHRVARDRNPSLVPVAKVHVRVAGGNPGLAWHAVPIDPTASLCGIGVPDGATLFVVGTGKDEI